MKPVRLSAKCGACVVALLAKGNLPLARSAPSSHPHVTAIRTGRIMLKALYSLVGHGKKC